VLFALIAALSLGQTPPHRLRQQPNLPRVSRGPSIESAVAAGDKSGSWWLLQTDGQMLSGSATTLSNVGGGSRSPMNFNGSSQSYESPTVAYPAGDFSVVVVFWIDPASTSCQFASKWGGTDISWSIEFLVGGHNGNAYVKSATGNLGAATFGGNALPAGQWLGIALTYTSATGAIKGRTGGVNVTATATGGGVFAQSEKHSLASPATHSVFCTGKSRGAFFTEKVLSDADIDRIIAGTM
jgi:hypothetical protein